MLQFSRTSNPEGDPVQDAFWEHLLCGICERRLQKWEEYAARVIYQKRLFDFPSTKPRELRKLADLNYPKLKLFLLSVLWRMSASSLPLFEQVRLGPHEQKIRDMLLSEDPGSVTDYGSTVVVVHLDAERVNLTRPGDVVRHKTHRLYRALLDGLLLTWVVGNSDHMGRFDLPQMFLQEDGSWLTHSRDLQSIAFLSHESREFITRESKTRP
jgi:hypothetical protein